MTMGKKLVGGLSARKPVFGQLTLTDDGRLIMLWDEWCQFGLVMDAGTLDTVEFVGSGAKGEPATKLLRTQQDCKDFIPQLRHWLYEVAPEETIVNNVTLREVKNFLDMWMAVRADLMLEPLSFGGASEIESAKSNDAKIAYTRMLEVTDYMNTKEEESYAKIFGVPKRTPGFEDGLIATCVRLGGKWLYVEDLSSVSVKDGVKNGTVASVANKMRGEASYLVAYGAGSMMSSFYVYQDTTSFLYFVYLVMAFQRLAGASAKTGVPLKEMQEEAVGRQRASWFANANNDLWEEWGYPLYAYTEYGDAPTKIHVPGDTGPRKAGISKEDLETILKYTSR